VLYKYKRTFISEELNLIGAKHLQDCSTLAACFFSFCGKHIFRDSVVSDFTIIAISITVFHLIL